MFVLEYAGTPIAGITIHEEPHPGWKKAYVNAVPLKAITGIEGVRAVLSDVASRLRESGMRVLQAKVYGPGRDHDEIRAAFFEILGEMSGPAGPGMPPTILEGMPVLGGIFGGLQMICVACEPPTGIETLRYGGQPAGLCLEHPLGREIFIAGIDGCGSDDGHAVQARQMFRNASDMLAAFGASFHNVARTWIYFPHILEWYGLFNRVRNDFFSGIDLLDGETARVPASTGIQGKRSEEEVCFMDLLALMDRPDQPNGQRWTQLSNPSQNEAYAYKSAFARAVGVSVGSAELVYLSGTASIDQTGKTRYQDDPQGQITQTFSCIADLLGQKGMGLKHLCMATVYCKDASIYAEFSGFTRRMGLSDIPFVPVFADVCRDDLLFEIDGIALINQADGA